MCVQEPAVDAVPLKHRVRPTTVTLADNEFAIIVEYIQEDFVLLPDGNKYGEVKGTSTKTKKVKVRRDGLAKGVDELLKELLNKTKWMKVISDDVRSKLVELQQREAEKGSSRKAAGDCSVAPEAQDPAREASAAGKLSKSSEEGRHRRREGGKKHQRSRVEKISSVCLLWSAQNALALCS